MGDHRKREVEKAALDAAAAATGVELAKRPPVEFVCQACGAPARWAVSAHKNGGFWCDEHLPPEWRAPIESR